MTKDRKNEIMSQIFELVKELAYDMNRFEFTADKPAPDTIEMLTIKECTDIIPGFSEHSVRKLIKQGKVKSIRTGEGERGKFLVNKDSLIDYLKK